MAENQLETKRERLKKIRKDKDLDQTGFGALFSLSQNYISALEKDKYDIPIEVMVKLVEMGYNLNWLMAGVEGMNRLEDEQLQLTAEPSISYEERQELDRLRQIEVFLKDKFPDFKL